MNNSMNDSGFFERNRLSGGRLLKRKAGETFFGICRALLIIGLCFLILQPLLDKISVSFMAENDLYDATVISIPRNITLNNYRLVAEITDYGPSLARTILVCLAGAFLQTSACALAAYGFARYNFPLKKFWFMCVILIIILPPQTMMAPLYLNFRFFDIFGLFRLITGSPVNMLNNAGAYLMLSVTGMGLKSGLYIFLLRQYFRGVPKELEEAAYVDGCGRLKTFIRIMLPDAAPMLTSCFLFSFVWQWTDSFYTTMFLSRFRVLSAALDSLAVSIPKWWEVNSGKNSLISVGYTQALIATGMLMCLAPLILLYLVAQRSFVRSLSQTGLKM